MRQNWFLIMPKSTQQQWRVNLNWQETNQKIEIKSQQSKRLNVLGFLSKSNELEAYTFSCSINSDVVIACIDKFCEKVNKKTVLVMDNSSIHQNNLFWDKEDEWREKG